MIGDYCIQKTSNYDNNILRFLPFFYFNSLRKSLKIVKKKVIMFLSLSRTRPYVSAKCTYAFKITLISHKPKFWIEYCGAVACTSKIFVFDGSLFLYAITSRSTGMALEMSLERQKQMIQLPYFSKVIIENRKRTSCTCF